MDTTTDKRHWIDEETSLSGPDYVEVLNRSLETCEFCQEPTVLVYAVHDNNRMDPTTWHACQLCAGASAKPRNLVINYGYAYWIAEGRQCGTYERWNRWTHEQVVMARDARWRRRADGSVAVDWSCCW